MSCPARAEELVNSITSLFSVFFVTIPWAPTVFGIAFTFMFHSFFSSWARSKFFLAFRFLSPSFCCLLAKSTMRQFILFYSSIYLSILFINSCFSLLAKIWRRVGIVKFQRILSFHFQKMTLIWSCTNYKSRKNFSLLHNSLQITFRT